MQEYTPFPPPQQPRKVDLEMESGEYFLTATQKASRAEHEKQERQREAQDAKKRKREEPYLPPKVLFCLYVYSAGVTFSAGSNLCIRLAQGSAHVII